MPFKSEAQRKYLWANEPEIARDWTDTYGSRIEKDDGGIMRVPFQGGGMDASKADFGASGRDFGGKDETAHRNIHAGMISPTVQTHTTAPGTLSDIREKQDYFNQTWSGQPGFLGLGGGYRNLKTPNEAGSGYQSRLNPMGLMSLLGGFMKKPFTLAATGINAVRNKFGPAWKDWMGSKYFNEFLNKRRAAQYQDAIAKDNLYDPNAKLQSTSFKQNLPEETNIDNSMWGADQEIFGIENARGLFRPDQMSTDFNIKYGPEGITYYEDELPEEDVITGTNYPGEDIRTETILDRAKEMNEQRDPILAAIRRTKRAREKLNPPWPRM